MRESEKVKKDMGQAELRAHEKMKIVGGCFAGIVGVAIEARASLPILLHLIG